MSALVWKHNGDMPPSPTERKPLLREGRSGLYMSSGPQYERARAGRRALLCRSKGLKWADFVMTATFPKIPNEDDYNNSLNDLYSLSPVYTFHDRWRTSMAGRGVRPYVSGSDSIVITWYGWGFLDEVSEGKIGGANSLLVGNYINWYFPQTQLACTHIVERVPSDDPTHISQLGFNAYFNLDGSETDNPRTYKCYRCNSFTSFLNENYRPKIVYTFWPLAHSPLCRHGAWVNKLREDRNNYGYGDIADKFPEPL